MEVMGVRLLVDFDWTLEVVAFLLLGVTLGTVSGLTPGLHANNFALLLASVAPTLSAPPMLLGVAMLAAGVVHTFLDVVPAMTIGVPDAAMAVTALPAHQLVLEGRGHEALRLSALGSGLAVVCAVPLAIPITLAMTELYPIIRPRISLVLAALAVFLVATEHGRRAKIGAAAAFIASASVGAVTLDLVPDAPLDAGGMLSPLLAGLFGAPVLVDAFRGSGVPPQGDTTMGLSAGLVARVALGGTIAGALVGYLPGVSSAIAAVVVLAGLPTSAGSRGFIVATSGVNTANTVFALFALVALGTPRTGVLVALNEAGVPLNLPLLLLSVGFAAAIGFALVPLVGDRYMLFVGQLDYAKLSVVVLVGLAVVAFLFAGPVGVVVFAGSAVIGLIPPRTGARRVHCMGVLILPVVLGS